MARPLALTMGEPAGIGGEIALRAFERRQEAGVPDFFLIDDADRLRELAGRLGIAVPIREIDTPAGVATGDPEALAVLPVGLPARGDPGRPSPATAPAVIAAIDRAVDLCRRGEAAGLVTNPISKAVLQDAGFRHPGHTEYLADRAGGGKAVMMLAGPSLRVVPVTVHVSLRAAIAALTADAIVEAARICAAALERDFRVTGPRLAVAGLNPHAGESGRMGREDMELVAPAVERLRGAGIDARGPLPPDTMFHPAARRRYDAAICMYHDQALIPLKTLHFDDGVNVTLGLPIVRTSPDHGTAFDIAGRGVARPDSLIAALRMAADIARNREAHDRPRERASAG